MGQSRFILQVVGYQDSGKTTLVEKLIGRLKEQGVSTAVIKHHGHGGSPDSEITAKDSLRHFNAGAIAAGVAGAGVLRLSVNVAEWSLEKLIQLYDFFAVDLLLIEGYKQEDYPKIVCIRHEEELHLLTKLTRVLCVITHVPIPQEHFPNLRCFQVEEEQRYMDYLLNKVVRKE
ncbi:molybdopterin-guanine dinucleotide biosynthesis protein B [Pullulanibacillus pueri]|uniref:Molybdopterin-guanine dinucleotide biosynthesis protein MobB n=1 Tax=Pullulanibacillus pueri TaxID=1437324 RepID=A0A8J3EMZ8_9BACL|nr:molybdopterin-guanine dinucleotide biosynthesis protein B [Pullulanibacillus pueri]MBM7681008.1 molybdopterin-guanine dinucleotide biosynthesis protein B [Pullulanibacillus pueri]GGH86284.1 molybdopterin-guanine dinucleotide biosynthesis protein MobB [Pullulanibacillus pueri]